MTYSESVYIEMTGNPKDPKKEIPKTPIQQAKRALQKLWKQIGERKLPKL